MNGFYWESDWKGLSREGQVLADQPILRFAQRLCP